MIIDPDRASYQDGFDLAHDVGLGAREEARPFVAGVREGFDAGMAELMEIIDQLTRPRPRRGS